ncbi:MAG: short-chain dehydrogenase [Flavobacteriales bacterium]|jgi:3-oxoacyl-[acyl-carrier protein] reductase|nr:short-chain dehydrogenase [Flavobacteriales bacterium]|tara:strand:+ start:42107 stop:42892 length:786 start_codon:yes stop_codon:yes gene_type:complete
MEINLKNKTAWVFGGSRGIGKATAIKLSQSGANILLIARNRMALQKAQSELCTKFGQEHDSISLDMADSESIYKQLNNYINLNSVDILINNSGGPEGGLAHTADLDEYKLAFQQHVLSAQVVSKIVIGVMKKKRFGRIINIISTSVKQPIEGLGVSNTIRGAMANWAKTLANELGSYQVTVNNILPGATQTNRLVELIQKKAIKNNCDQNIIAEKMKKSIPVGRFATPEEIAYMIVFLCSSYANYITGVNIPIDGGRTKSL